MDSAVTRQAVSPEDLEAMRATVRVALTEMAPLPNAAMLSVCAPNWDRERWKRLSQELSLVAIGLPEAYGGQGFGRLEQGIILEEMGRVLYAGPYLATAVLAAQALALSGDHGACNRWLPGIARGDTIAAMINGADTLHAAPDAAGRWIIDGETRVVVSASDADRFVAVANSANGPVLLTFPATTPGVLISPLPVLDLTRGLASVRLDGVSADIVGVPGPSTAETVRKVDAAARSALASEQAGASSAILEITIAYAKSRIQFGREIGSFQAVRHRLADLYAEVEMATAAARHAAAIVDVGTPEASLATAVAASFCSETFVLVAEEAMQLHGGIGFTWEHPCHLFLKRAKSSEILFGSPEKHRAGIYHDILVLNGSAS